MKKFLLVTCAFFCFSVPSLAKETGLFYHNREGTFITFGFSSPKEKESFCMIGTTYSEGSELSLFIDLDTKELALTFKGSLWKIRDPAGQRGVMFMTFSFKEKPPVSLKFNLELMNHNTIVVRNVIGDNFLPNFMDAIAVEISMPGDVPNVEINLKDTYRATIDLHKCVLYNEMNKQKTAL